MTKLNPKVDFAFKKLFGSEENKDILISFINSILDEENKVKDIELKNPYNIANYKSGKMSILDIKATDENGRWYDIEMQISEQGYYDKRALYYWSKVYSDQIENGNKYYELKKTIGINILDFNYLKEENFHNVYKIFNRSSGNEFSDLLEIHFIELNKLNKDYKNLKTTLERWVKFLNEAYKFDKEKLPEEIAETEIVKAARKLEIMSLDNEERQFYESELKSFLNHAEDIRTAEEKGVKKGLEEGEKKKSVEIAKNLLGLLGDSIIAEKTGLTTEEVKNLKVKMKKF